MCLCERARENVKLLGEEKESERAGENKRKVIREREVFIKANTESEGGKIERERERDR